jgi:hypothetical protein
MFKKIFILIATILLLSNCRSNDSMYNWGNYERNVHNHNKSPIEKEKFAKNLQKIIKNGEKTNQVPPGIYAEYGYIMLELKNYDKAINYFNKEKKLWPESSKLMNIMIKRTNIQNKNNKK